MSVAVASIYDLGLGLRMAGREDRGSHLDMMTMMGVGLASRSAPPVGMWIVRKRQEHVSDCVLYVYGWRRWGGA